MARREAGGVGGGGQQAPQPAIDRRCGGVLGRAVPPNDLNPRAAMFWHLFVRGPRTGLAHGIREGEHSGAGI